MLEPILYKLANTRVILASNSPRRKEIFAQACPNLPIEIVPSFAEENLDPLEYGENPWSFAIDTARLKATEVFERISVQNTELQDVVVVGADTVVTLEKTIFGKPKDTEDALRILSALNGRSHKVYSGVVILRGGQGILSDQRSFFESTTVTFDKLSEEVIKNYIDTKEPLDKAGAYGIQGLGGTLVQSIEGCYFNVVGFPLHKFAKNLLDIIQSDPPRWQHTPDSCSETLSS